MEQEKIISSNTLFVGQILYLDNKTEIKEVSVRSIGRKYFYLNGWEASYPIGKENLRYESKNYSQHNFQLYRTKQEILARKEKTKLIDRLRRHFDWSGTSSENTLEQLREAANVLFVGENDKL